MASSVFDIEGGMRKIRLSPEMLRNLFAQTSRIGERPDDAYLMQHDGDSWTGVHRLRTGQVVEAGRVTSEGILVTDDRCSRRHCQFYQQDQSWYVRDLGSRNGTRVNGERIQLATKLKDGDRIRIGKTRFVFTLDPSSVNDVVDDDSSSDSV